MADNLQETPHTFYTSYAGVVILTPFIQPYFARLNLLHNHHFISQAAQVKALYALQYLVSGNEGHPTPDKLELNKIICGLPVNELYEIPGPLTDAEKELGRQLLDNVIARWEITKGTSITALRETFLERMGQVKIEDGITRLRVDRKTLDLLIDQLPWSFSSINFPWMEQAVLVSW